MPLEVDSPLTLMTVDLEAYQAVFGGAFDRVAQRSSM